ncbi:hypothetical protein EMIT0P74_120199 [Pseudomonas sp. IT-P74]
MAKSYTGAGLIENTLKIYFLLTLYFYGVSFLSYKPPCPGGRSNPNNHNKRFTPCDTFTSTIRAAPYWAYAPPMASKCWAKRRWSPCLSVA